MERKSIGGFIAALRRANGLTQQELADKLCVSNKAVSRWERDETLPDLTLIPAIAEIFGVTCDEILRGERSSTVATNNVSADEDEEAASRAEARDAQKSKKRAAAIVTGALSKFKSANVVAIALTLLGTILLVMSFVLDIGTASVIIFVIAVVSIVASILLTIIALMRLRDTCGIEIADTCDERTVARYERTMVNYSYASFAVLFVVLWMAATSNMSILFYGIHPFQIYFINYTSLAFVLLTPASILILCKRPYTSLLTGRRIIREVRARTKKFYIISAVLVAVMVAVSQIQIALLAYLDDAFIPNLLGVAAAALLLAIVADAIVYAVRENDSRASAIVVGAGCTVVSLGVTIIAYAIYITTGDGGASYGFYTNDVMLGATIILVASAVCRIVMNMIEKRKR